MTVDDLKRELIEYMEKVHGSRYHRNFFGCLTALLVEDGPTTQERIMELTQYSRASVSLALQKIQLTLPVRVLKILGDRKHYYEYQGGPEQFLVDILNRRTDIPDIDLEMIHTIQKKVEMKVQEHASYCKLWNYLKELQLYLELMHSVRKKNLEKFKMVLQSGSFDELNLPEASALNSGKIANFLNTLMTSEDPSKIEHEPTRGKLPLPYIELKREYFRGIKTGLNPLYAQSVANLLIIVHDVIIEKATTQEAIQESTQLPRSTISDVLSLAVDEGVIKVEKFPGSRTKVYRPAISLVKLILNYYDRAFAYASNTRKKIVDVVNGMQDITPEDSEFMVFLEKLNVLKRAYTITEEFTIRAKAEFVKELMSEYGGRT
jgi:DNA-binding transcriptional regulator GbsR (MarR family)